MKIFVLLFSFCLISMSRTEVFNLRVHRTKVKKCVCFSKFMKNIFFRRCIFCEFWKTSFYICFVLCFWFHRWIISQQQDTSQTFSSQSTFFCFNYKPVKMKMNPKISLNILSWSLSCSKRWKESFPIFLINWLMNGLQWEAVAILIKQLFKLI